MKITAAENVTQIVPYPPGKPQDELEREYGVRDSIKLASNENPFGPSPKAVAAITEILTSVHRYPDGSNYYLLQELAKWIGCAPEQIVCGNGSNEVIEFLVKAFVTDGDEVITSHPSFLMYQKFVQVRGGINTVIPLKDMRHDLEAIIAATSEKTKLIFLDNPNNPTGTLISRDVFEEFISQLPETVIVVLDEAYVDFVTEGLRIDLNTYCSAVPGRPGVVSLRTFSKAFGLAGLRIGFGIMPVEIADMLHRVRQPFTVNLPAQVGALAALSDDAHYGLTMELTAAGLQWLSGQMKELGCTPYPSYTNFFLVDVKGDATALYEAMLYKGVIIRSMKAYGFPSFIRITVGTAEENSRLVTALAECLEELNYV